MFAVRLRRLVNAITGHAITEIEAAHPEAVLDHERQQLRLQVARYNHGLAAHAGVCERLRKKATRLEARVGELSDQVGERLANGERDAAAEAALELEEVQADLAKTRTQLADAEETYRELLHARNGAIRAARRKIEGLRRAIGETKAQKALADISELAAGLHGTIGVCEGTLERVHERLDEDLEMAVGRTRVARDSAPLETREADLRDREQAAAAALRRFEAADADAAQEPEDDARDSAN